LPYKFTAKELDSETGLYYYGWRYLDPRTGTWCSADPALAEYLPTGDKNKNLPGEGGVFKTVNMNLYHYAGNNPIRYTDPNGKYCNDVHLYMTAYLAKKAGFSDKDVSAISRANGNVDRLHTAKTLTNTADRLEWHFPESADGKTHRNSKEARSKLESSKIDPIKNMLYLIGNKDALLRAFGEGLHVVQDSYSHEGYGDLLGHSSDKIEPDLTTANMDKTIEMAHQTYNDMLDFRRSKGEKVKDNWGAIEKELRNGLIQDWSLKYNSNDPRNDKK